MSRARNAYAAPAWAAEQRLGDVGTKAVLLLLANYADEDFSCYPGQKRIADETEQSDRTVRRQLEYLEEAGLIRREHRYNEAGKRTSDRYYLDLDVMVGPDEAKAAKQRMADRKTQAVAKDEAAGPSAGLVDNLTTSPDGAASADYRTPATPTTGHGEHSLPDTGVQVTPRRTPRGTPSGSAAPLRNEAAPELSLVLAEDEGGAKLPTVKERARALTKAWWDRLPEGGKPVQRFAGAMKIIEGALANGIDENLLKRGLDGLGQRNPTLTAATLNIEIQKVQGQHPSWRRGPHVDARGQDERAAEMARAFA